MTAPLTTSELPASVAGQSLGAARGYAHPTTIQEFESVHRHEYEQKLESCDRWIKWCEHQNPPDTHGMNFHQGLRSAHVFNNIKMEQLLRVLKQEAPNARGGHNADLRHSADSATLEPAREIKRVKMMARCMAWGALVVNLVAFSHMNSLAALIVGVVGGFGAGSLAIISTYRERF